MKSNRSKSWSDLRFKLKLPTTAIISSLERASYFGLIGKTCFCWVCCIKCQSCRRFSRNIAQKCIWLSFFTHYRPFNHSHLTFISFRIPNVYSRVLTATWIRKNSIFKSSEALRLLLNVSDFTKAYCDLCDSQTGLCVQSTRSTEHFVKYCKHFRSVNQALVFQCIWFTK